MIDAELLKILCCPETHQPLRWASAEQISALNHRLESGGVKNRAGKPVSERLEAGLVREDNQLLYPVRNQIPNLLVDEGISLIS